MFSKPGLYCLPCRIIAAIGSRVEHILHGEPPQQSPRLLVTDGEMHLRELAADLVKWAEVFNDGPELAAKIGIGRDRYMTATVIQGWFLGGQPKLPGRDRLRPIVKPKRSRASGNKRCASPLLTIN